jgi:hypothetical protein
MRLQLPSRGVASLALIALSPFVASWFMRWPVFADALRPVSLVHDFHVGRRRYLLDLVIRRGEDVEYAICVLCSVRVEGRVERDAVALWGDVHVATGGAAPGKVAAMGGSVSLDSGATVPYFKSIEAFGGTVRIHPALIDSVVRLMDVARQQSPYPDRRTGPLAAPRPVELPSFYYPGQRTLTLKGVGLVIGGFILVALLGTVVVPPWRSARADDAVRQPWRSLATVLAVCAALLLISYPLVGVAYFFPPAWLVSIAGLEWLWFALAVGLGAVCRWLGTVALREPARSSLRLGAVLLAMLLMVPVVGAAIQLMLILVASGAGIRALTARAAN